MSLVAGLHALSCLVVLVLSLCSLNRMGRGTHHSMRLAVGVVAVAAFAGLAAAVDLRRDPSVTELLVFLGMALGMLDNRRKTDCPCSWSAISRLRPPPERGRFS